MNVMVLGATGFIGCPLVRWLADAGHEVPAVSPQGGRASRSGVTATALDRDDPSAIAQAGESWRAEAVIDLLAMTLAATQPLLDALAGRVGRYVMASSGDVYRQYGALHRLESAERPIDRLGEDAPLRTRLHPYRATPPRSADDPAGWMDDYDKIPIEQAVAAPDLPAVVARLPMTHGPATASAASPGRPPMLAGSYPAIEMTPSGPIGARPMATWTMWRPGGWRRPTWPRRPHP